MRTERSRLDKTATFDQNNWAVSVVNTGIFFAGHALLVVEGIDENDQLFIGQYDFSAGTREDRPQDCTVDNALSTNTATERASGATTDISTTQSQSTGPSGMCTTLGNIQGIITKIKCRESHKYTRDYSEFRSVITYDEVPRLDAFNMINSIKEDEQKTERAWAGEDTFIPYQFLGSDSIFGKRDAGVNCAQWVKNKLTIAGIDHGDPKSKPKKVAGGRFCTIS